jgi:DNA-binding CsgD family transcriptional regulator
MTRRQKECLVMLCCGCSTEQIEEALHISKSTVYNHLNSLYGAFHAGSRTEMVALAWEMGLVTFRDIRLYNRKKERRQIPEWAAVKRECDRFYFD